MRTAQSLLLLGSLLLAACPADPPQDSDSGESDAGPPDSGVNSSCGPGLEPHGRACVPAQAACATGLKAAGPACAPVFADCTKNEVPLLGGGCKPVGVEECPGGLKLPADTQCTPIGPTATCQLGGWAKVAGGWCEPRLPAAACPKGTLEVLGESTCQPVGDCGTGTYGGIQTSSKTIFVDLSFRGSGSDGSQAKPFTTIGQALQAAAAGAQIAVAAGNYAEDLTVDKQVAIEGRCAQMVTVTGQDPSKEAAVQIAADNAELRGLTISGPGLGVQVQGVAAVLQRLAILGAADGGLGATQGAKLLVSDSLIADNVRLGIGLKGAEVTLERSVVRGTLPRPTDNKYGTGIQAAAENVPSTLTLRDCLVTGNHTFGVVAAGTTATLQRTVVRDTAPQPADQDFGIGVSAYAYQSQPSTLTLEDCVVANNSSVGVAVDDATATLERTVVRDTQPQASDQTGGRGIQALGTVSPRPPLVLRDCLVSGNRDIALSLHGTPTTLQRTVVRDTVPQQASDKLGVGVSSNAALTLEDCLVAGNRTAGVVVSGQQATLKRTVVRDTTAPPADTQGIGIVTYRKVAGSSLSVSDCLVTQNSSAGISISGFAATLERTVVRDTAGMGIVTLSQVDPPRLTATDCVVDLARTAGILAQDADTTLERVVVGDTESQASDGKHGYGILALNQTRPAKLSLRECLIQGNRAAGVEIWGSEATLERTAVLDTRAHAADKLFGGGVTASYSGGPSTLTVTDCEVARNRTEGIAVWGSKATVLRSLVRETQPTEADQTLGVGLTVAWDQQPAELTLRDSVVAKNRSTGVVLLGAKATLERSEVRDTLPQASNTAFGTGIYADDDHGPATLVVNDSLVADNRGAGMALFSSKGTVARSVVRGTVEHGGPAEYAGYGDGIQIALEGASLELSDCQVENSARAGLLFYEAGGKVARSVFLKGIFAIVLEKGSNPEIADDNVYRDNVNDGITMGQSLTPAPLPTVPPPPQLPPSS